MRQAGVATTKDASDDCVELGDILVLQQGREELSEILTLIVASEAAKYPQHVLLAMLLRPDEAFDVQLVIIWRWKCRVNSTTYRQCCTLTSLVNPHPHIAALSPHRWCRGEVLVELFDLALRQQDDHFFGTSPLSRAIRMITASRARVTAAALVFPSTSSVT